jgi:hypothetical protein
MNSKLQTGLVAIFLLMLGLMTRPLITIPEGSIFSIPSLLIYIFCIWIGLIVVMRIVFFIEQKADDDTRK